MGNFAERIHELVIELAEGNANKFAQNAGIPQSTFQNYKKGRLPHSDQLIRLKDTYNVNVNWLLTGEGPKYLGKDGQVHKVNDWREMQRLALEKEMVGKKGPGQFKHVETMVGPEYSIRVLSRRIDGKEEEDDEGEPVDDMGTVTEEKILFVRDLLKVFPSKEFRDVVLAIGIVCNLQRHKERPDHDAIVFLFDLFENLLDAAKKYASEYLTEIRDDQDVG